MVDFAETFPKFAVKRPKVEGAHFTQQSPMCGQCLGLFGLNHESVSLSAERGNILR